MIKSFNPALAVVIALGGYLLVTSASYPVGSLSVFDAKRIIQLALFAGLLIFAVAWAPLRTATITQLGRLSTFSVSIVVLFFLIGIASSLRLEHPAYALVDVSMLFIMLVMIAVIAGSRGLSGRHFDKWVVVLLALMGLAVAIQELMGFVANWMLGSEFSYTQALVHFAHPRFYNQLQTWSMPVLAALPLLFPDKRWIRLACIVLLGLQWFLVIAYAARGTAVSLTIAMIFIAFWCPGQRRSWLKYQLGGILAGVIVYLGILQLNGLLIPQAESGELYTHSVGRPMLHTTGRSSLWRLSVQDAIEHPVLGSGPTRYACDNDITTPAHPHSFPIRIMGEWGLVATLLVIILATIAGLGLLRNLQDQADSHADLPLRVVLAISLVAGVVHSCVSGLLIMPASQVAMVLIAGWAFSLNGAPSRPHKPSLFAQQVLIAAVLIACTQLFFALKEIPQLPERTGYSKSYGPAMPRFWQNGRVCEYRYEPR